MRRSVTPSLALLLVAAAVSLTSATLASGEGLGYRPVRKVHAHLYTWNGNWRHNRFGLASWWALDRPHAQAVGTLERKIDRLASGSGVRHFVLQLPAGSVQPKMCASQFLPLPKERRRLLKEMARRLKAKYPGLKLGVYCGWALDPTPETVEMTGWRFPDFSRPEDRRAIVRQYGGWSSIGFDFLVLDAISSQHARDRTAIAWLRYLEKECRLRTVGEAYPKTEVGRRGRVDYGAVDQHAWMALKRFIDRNKIPGDWRGARYMGLNGHIPDWKASEDRRRAIVSECVERGFVPWIYEYRSSEETAALLKHAVEVLAAQERAHRR